MRLKTKLVLAITALVFLISGLLSLVYVSQLLHSAVQQSYDTNRMVANQMRFACAMLWRPASRTANGRSQQPGPVAQPGGRGGARQRRAAGGGRIGQPLLAHRLRHQHRRQPVSTLLSTNPDNEDKPLPVRPNLSSFLTPIPFQLMRGLRSARVFDVVVPWSAMAALCHRARGRAHHAAARRL
jgi:hypothetical protein